MTGADLHWLPVPARWSEEVAAARDDHDNAWPRLCQLANHRLDFVRTNQVDRLARQLLPDGPPAGGSVRTLRLAILASCTVVHLLPGLRVAAMRRGFFLDVYVSGYGQYQQELLDKNSELYRFAPDIVLFALDARHIVGHCDAADGEAAVEASVGRLARLWQQARAAFGCQVLQQAALPVFPALVGGNEHRYPESGSARLAAFNHALRSHADREAVDIVALDAAVQRNGLASWYDPMLWHGAKQEIHISAAPLYGDLVMRLVAARQGRSFKCLVLDLDNTLWGGVIGDDGLEGIVLGQGSAEGEAFIDFQHYAADLARRGVILAVCSKNDEANALAPFERHPEMVLKRSDIACFVANWDDKPANLREIARRVNIGLDAMAFADDNPYERNIVRRELPMVAVPEMPEDPANYAACIADAGYFEAVSLTAEDLERTRLYQANLEREALQATATDLSGYLKSLRMTLFAKPFDKTGARRIVQLINKTNQFNLTTRRYTDEMVGALIGSNEAVTLQLRLTDSFGDNGVIAIIIALPRAPECFVIDTWLMSCRVLGRQVEEACMNALASAARRLGVRELIGEFIPTERNQMVKDHYRKLGFAPLDEAPNGQENWHLDLERFEPFETCIAICEE
jgi:FkbH-like protein